MYFQLLLLYSITCTASFSVARVSSTVRPLVSKMDSIFVGTEAQAQRRHRIRCGLLRVDDRCGFRGLCLSGGAVCDEDDALQRVDQRGLPQRHRAERIGRGNFAAAASAVREFLGLRAIAVKTIERAMQVRMYFFIVSYFSYCCLISSSAASSAL